MNEIKDNLTEQKTWVRGLYMLMFAIFYGIAKVVLSAVIIFQFLLVLFTAETNTRLLKLGQSLSTYSYQIMMFLTFNSEYQPYPFGAWPKGEPRTKEATSIEQDD
ncbi:MAG: DUF4389 domain-containing protein [Gammaproteobacteria bacterium]|nr:DUF4389 domain-containing protein [Gammaproteobacteria bacterium]